MPAHTQAMLEQQDVERIARRALNDLGVAATTLSVVPSAAQPDVWRIDFGGDRPLQVRCGRGTTAEWVRSQIVEQVLAR